MRDLEGAEKLLSRVYEADIHKTSSPLDVSKELQEVGVQTLHIAYYDSGIAQQEEIRKHLRDFPNGQLAQLIRGLRDARLGEYSQKRLDLMYGLTAG